MSYHEIVEPTWTKTRMKQRKNRKERKLINAQIELKFSTKKYSAAARIIEDFLNFNEQICWIDGKYWIRNLSTIKMK